MQKPRRVLIAHQSTIPHYRVRFYELLEQRRPADWSFDVAYDLGEARNPTIYTEKTDANAFPFPILDSRIVSVGVGGKRVIWQKFFAAARRYDAIITDTHLTNLTYPAVSLYALAGRKRVFWGHPRNMNVENMGRIQRLGQALKMRWLMCSDYFFAYTPAGRDEVVRAGYDPGRVAVIDNTIDTVAERAAFENLSPRREEIRKQLGVADRKVIISVNRLIPDKRIAFLLQAFEEAWRRDPSLHLFVVGSGPDTPLVQAAVERLGSGVITYFGAVSERDKLAPLFAASDLYVITGAIGLGPLQAFCHNLPAVGFELSTHGPEVEYLTPVNSVMLPGTTSAADFASELPDIMARFAEGSPRDGIYDSISHLTIERMVENFIAGVNAVFGIR